MKEIVRIITLGCKVNQFESESFRAGFEDAGFLVADKEAADIVVINTCGVTGAAGAQSRQTIRKALRSAPDARIVITGCYAELMDGSMEAELAKRDCLFVGNAKKDLLVETVLAGRTPGKLMGDISKAETICNLPVRRFGKRSRAYLRVQDGCESYCSYCIVPFTRGPSRSQVPEEAIHQARVFSDEGHREIVITGIHLGYYGRDLSPNTNLIELIDRLSLATPQTLYRISSLEPTEITTELLQLMDERDNIQPHLHIPLQSGCDTILQKMNRHYTTEQFRQTVLMCREMLPDCGIGIDILAGFPGETEAQFQEALHFLETLPFSYLHVFPYSPRPGTKAASFSNQVPGEIRRERARQLRALSMKKQQDFNRSQIGRTLSLLVEGKRDERGMLRGVTGNYVTVHFPGPDSLLGDCVFVRLLKMENTTVIGEREES